VPVLVTAVTLVPFIVMGDVPGMELLHIAAAVILGGLATTALVGLAVLPAASRLFGPAPAVESDETLAAIAMAGGPDVAGEVPDLARTVPNARQPAEALSDNTGYDHAGNGHRESVQADNAEPALVRDTGDGHRQPPLRNADPQGDPVDGVRRPDSAGFGEDA